MEGLEPLGRVLLVVGILVAILGAFLLLGVRIPLLGRLPGDIRFERDGLVIVIPIASMLVLSIVLTILLNLLGRGR
jgi:hypothetical protein